MTHIIRNCSDIGLAAFDRPRTTTCKWRTNFCNENCYNKKLEAAFNHHQDYPIDLLRDDWWRNHFDVKEFVTALYKNKLVKQTGRFRWCTRGELLNDNIDYEKLAKILKATPDILHWCPSRAWRNSIYSPMYLQKAYPNFRFMCSIDPSNTVKELESIRRIHSTIYFGNNEIHPLELIEPVEKCPKTWGKIKGNCGSCTLCFGSERVHVWLKKH